MPNFNIRDLLRFKPKWDFFITALILLFAVDIILLNFPLTNILGYEYSASNAIIITLLSGFYAIHLLKKDIFLLGKEDILSFLGQILRANIYFQVLPFLLSFVAAIFVRNCSFLHGILFYIVLTLPASIIGTSLALAAYFLIPKFPRIVFSVLFLIILFSPIFEIYFNPQIYFFNSIIGYYPGTIYDESLSVSFKLVIYRLLNLLFFCSIGLWALRSISSRKQFSLRNVLLFAGVIVVVSGIFVSLESPLGYATTESRMKSELSGNLETDHFSIYFDKKIGRTYVENLALLHEYYYQEVVHYLNAEPKGKITSFLFLNSAQKKELLGSAEADVAMPWKYQIFINFDNYDETLKHEIAHCVSASFGVTPFRISSGFNPALLEGIATAADNRYNYNTIDYMASLAYNNGYRFPIETLFQSLNFFGQTSSLSYIYAGSFIKFLIERYGIERFKRIYRGEAYASVYDKSLSDLGREYYYYIGGQNLALNRKDEANFYYGRPTIFKKVCARYMAKKVEDGWQLYNSGDYNKSKELFEYLLNYSDSYQPLLGYIYSLRKLNDAAMALAILNQRKENFRNSSYYYNLELLEGDLSVANKEFQSAGAIYRQLITQSPSIEYHCLSSLRERIVNDTSLISRYINGSEYDKYSLLKKLNSDSVFTASIPAMINLSEKLNENYQDFVNFIKNRLSAYSLTSSYAALKMSKYALKKRDFENARIFALTALNYQQNKDFTEMLNENLKQVNWFLYSSDVIRLNFKWNSY
ncbi:MAG: hypothetical protein Q8940_02925 [Bacteroidota bacterium]|nr:hypothetical protein [Bacteroidota bacterium]